MVCRILKMMSKKINRRTFIKAALTTGIALGGGLILGCENTPATSNELKVKFLRQIITKDSTTSRCIMWQTDSPMTEPIVEITVGDEVKKISAKDSTFTDDGTENIQYTAQIDELKPNSTYEFKIVDGDKSTGNFELKTYDENKFSGIIFPDSQSADYEVWGNTAKAAFEKNPDAEFFINMGDIVDNGEDRQQWEAWMTQVEEPLKKIPFVPIMGNHECYTRDWKERYPMAYLNYFATPENDNKFFDRRYYSFDFGAAHFMILDSQWDELETFAPGIIDAQKKWLQKELEGRDGWPIAGSRRDRPTAAELPDSSRQPSRHGCRKRLWSAKKNATSRGDGDRPRFGMCVAGNGGFVHPFRTRTRYHRRCRRRSLPHRRLREAESRNGLGLLPSAFGREGGPHAMCAVRKSPNPMHATVPDVRERHPQIRPRNLCPGGR